MTDEPMPRQGVEDVRPHVERLFSEILAAQCAKGEAKYGTRLQTFNGRDALNDALAELVDAVQYVTQAKMERDGGAAENAELREELKQDAALRQSLSQRLAYYENALCCDIRAALTSGDTVRAIDPERVTAALEERDSLREELRVTVLRAESAEGIAEMLRDWQANIMAVLCVAHPAGLRYDEARSALLADIEKLAAAEAAQADLSARLAEGGWSEEDLSWLFSRLIQEAGELGRAMHGDGGYGDIIHEAADVANFAMMIADICKKKVKP